MSKKSNRKKRKATHENDVKQAAKYEAELKRKREQRSLNKTVANELVELGSRLTVDPTVSKVPALGRADEDMRARLRPRKESRGISKSRNREVQRRKKKISERMVGQRAMVD